MPDYKENVVKLDSEIISPALIEAMAKAKAAGYKKNEAVNALVNATLNALIHLTGDRNAALQVLQDQIKFLQNNQV